ncbi:LysM peptidoglycan-binding domain-containing protein [Alicyclobacillus sp. SO9]|uniref:LysM peptidoglycan-binding domain-containing protein n=1 Tax=Alicyclobacillus sp. SO9 TaxID=2665646 RepID=UPI0018E6E2C9|nr:LysM peptidoglycan-binding domain-containing protein [Alicyclobacillus sp. SO9]QQE80985.1 LysM peptidoglycan-binding domain-containing protein [Alicyclobacillus sp. SO9]
MAVTCVPYNGQTSHGTWKKGKKVLAVKVSGLGRVHEEFHAGGRESKRTDGVRRSLRVARQQKGTYSSWVRRSVFWFVGVLVVLYAWNGLVSAQSTTTSYRVKSGDTLWSVASQKVPQRDPRVVIAQILNLNHINGTDYIYPGEVLKLPRR